MSAIGLRVGPFEVVEPAAVPESGDWFRAERVGITRRKPNRVLVKFLNRSASESDRAALQQEFDRLRAVEDRRVPGAIALYEGIGALAIDAPDGVSFQDIIDARHAGTITMTPATLLDLAIDVAECLQHAHHRNHHHGHLSAEHIRLSTSGKVFLFGFGPGPNTPPSASWSSPERSRGDAPSPLTDQWSLAAILSGLITGHSAWEEGRDPQTGDMSPTIEAVEGQWPALARLFRRMLEPRPENRFPTMHPVRQEFLALARKAGATSNRRDLGKLMARRIDRPITPDTEISAVPDPSPEPLPSPTPSTPEPPSVSFPARDPEDPPSIPDAHRAEPPEPALAAPLTAESLDIVTPDVEPGALAEARRPLDMMVPVEPEEEDTDDDPTVRFDPMLAKKIAALAERDTPVPQTPRPPDDGSPPAPVAAEDEIDDIVDPQTLARALAVAPDDNDGFGSMPTAVPITDAGEPSDVSDATAPVPTPAPSLAPPAPKPVVQATPTVQDLGERTSTDVINPEPLDARKFAPILVGVMLLLMVAVVVASLL